MNFQLTTTQQEMIASINASGHYSTLEEVVNEALELLRQRDELRGQLQRGVDQLNRGETIEASEVFAEIRRRHDEP